MSLVLTAVIVCSRHLRRDMVGNFLVTHHLILLKLTSFISWLIEFISCKLEMCVIVTAMFFCHKIIIFSRTNEIHRFLHRNNGDYFDVIEYLNTDLMKKCDKPHTLYSEKKIKWPEQY